MTGGRTDLRRVAIVVVKLIHSAIFLANVASILHIFWAGVRGRPGRWTGPALTAALTESAVFVANHGRCPLTSLVESLGAESGRVSDIFLPRWIADRTPQIFGPLLAIGLLSLPAVRAFVRRRVSRWGPSYIGVRGRPVEYAAPGRARTGPARSSRARSCQAD